MTNNDSNDRRRFDRALSDEAIEWVVHLHSGDATSADHAAFRAWRCRSPAHDSAGRDADELWRDLAETRAAAAHRRGPEVADIAAPKIDQASYFRRKLTRRMVLAGTMAASLAVVAAASSLLPPLAGVIADHSTRPGERREVRLPDGSRVLLNTATAVSVEFSARQRRLTLHAGEALFDVAADAERPFLVAVAAGEARALGTAFTVRRDGSQAHVVVSEGMVAVRAAGKSVSATLKAGQQASFGPDNQLRGPDPADLSSAMAWTRGKLVFNGRPLSEVVAELDRYRAGRILIVDEKLKRLKVSGVFDLDDPGQILRTLEGTLQVSVIRLPLLTLIR